MTYETQITLDLSGHQHSPSVAAKQGDKDSRFLVASLIANGQPYTPPEGATARISLIKPSGKCVLQDAAIEENGTVRLPLTEQMLAEHGQAHAQLMLFDDDTVLSSASIPLLIFPADYDRDAIESTPEYQTFVDALSQMQSIKEESQQVIEEAAAQANYAKEQGDAAKNAGEFCNVAYEVATEVIQRANEAMSSASTAAHEATEAADRANAAAEACESSGIPQLTSKLDSHISNKANPHRVTAEQIGAPTLDENGTLDIDVLPVGFTTIWWSDTLPSDKWAFGNTSIPSSCTKARQIWGATTPDTAGRVVVDKSNDSHFDAIKKTGGDTSQSLRALIGAVDSDSGTISYAAASPISGKTYARGIKGTIFGGGTTPNHTTTVTDAQGDTPSTLQPYIVARYIFKIK